MSVTTNIYCLLLENNKYYIGKARNVEKRFREHLSGKGAVWTKLNRPIKILEIFENVSPFLEDRYVKEYMFRYGIDKVRGGSYIKPELTSCQVYNLKREIWMATDCCFNCGDSHYCRDCKKILVSRDFVLIGIGVFLVLFILVLGGAKNLNVACYC